MELFKKMHMLWDRMPKKGKYIEFDDCYNIINRFKDNFINKIDVYNKIIIDYGCGGGWLGKILQDYNIKKYIGYDLCDDSINAAKKLLKGCKNIEIKKVINHDWDFRKDNPDIFCAFACILHFPTLEYLDRFLMRVNESNAKFLFLEIRNKINGNKFYRNAYANFESVVDACHTYPEYLQEKLTNYKLEYISEKDKYYCQILRFKGV